MNIYDGNEIFYAQMYSLLVHTSMLDLKTKSTEHKAGLSLSLADV